MESRLQVKMNPDSAKDVSTELEEPEDHPHLGKFHVCSVSVCFFCFVSGPVTMPHFHDSDIFLFVAIVAKS